MILLWGLRGDDPLEAVAEQLRRMRRPHVFIDQRAVLETRVELDASGCAGWVETPSAAFALEGISALYVRGYDARALPVVRNGGDAAQAHAAAIETALWCFADVAPIRVLNRPSAMASNNSKPFQAQTIRHYFAVPETLVTTDPDAGLAFWKHHGTAIYKSVSGQRSIVARLTPSHAERLADVRWCPTQLQQYIAGCDYRVHVIDRAVFCTEVRSDVDDYRYASRQGADCELRAYELPEDVAPRAIALAHALELPLAGIDLRRAADGTWYCFEVNPSPCFSYYEHHTGQPMAAAVAALLADSEERCR